MNGNRRYLTLVLVALLHGLNHSFVVSVLSPLYVRLRDYYGFEEIAPAMLVGTVLLSCYGISHFLFGFLADSFRKSLLLGLGGLGMSLCFLLVSWLYSYNSLLTLMALAGVFGATYHAIASALLTIAFPRRKGLALGIAGSGSSLGMVSAPIVSGYLAQRLVWQAPFFLYGMLGTVFSLVFLILARDPKQEPKPAESGTSWTPAVWRHLLMVGPIMAFREFCGWGSFSLIPTFMQLKFGCTVGQAGRVAALTCLGGLVSAPLFGRWSDNRGRLGVMAGLLLLVVVILSVIPSLSQQTALPAIFLFGFCYTATVPVLDALIADGVPERIRGAVFGIFAAVGIGFGSLGPWATGFVTDKFGGAEGGLRYPFYLLAGSAFLAILAIGVFWTRTRGRGGNDK